MPENTLSDKQEKVFKRQKKCKAKYAKKCDTNITGEKLDEMTFKLTKLRFMEDNDLKAQVEKKNVKKIFEKKLIFRSPSFELSIVFKILQKIDHLV